MEGRELRHRAVDIDAGAMPAPQRLNSKGVAEIVNAPVRLLDTWMWSHTLEVNGRAAI